MPIPASTWSVGAPAIEPAVVRIGPDRTLLDPPWGLRMYFVAHVWPDNAIGGGWARRTWPTDPSRRPGAPLDLHLGHVLDFVSPCHAGWEVRYGWVADVDERRMVVVPAASAIDAAEAASRAVDVWRSAELGEVERLWRERIAGAQRFYDSS